MKIGPKYKIARRLKAPVFEKTQTQKYSLREGRKGKSKSFSRPKTDFGMQLNEKQKARMFYGVTERQFAKYVKNALAKKSSSPAANLLGLLEHRLDNVVWRAGILPTHLAARQAVAHGHFLVNGRRVYVPSYTVKEGDKISIRESNKNRPLYAEIGSKEKPVRESGWFGWDNEKKEIKIKGALTTDKGDLLFDLGQVIEYYQR